MGIRIVKIFSTFDNPWRWKVELRSNSENFEVEYLENGTR